VANEVAFTFADGNKLTAQQLGYFSFRWSAQMAQEYIAAFSPGNVGATFPVASEIARAPFVAHLYIAGLHIASYLSLVATVLRAPEPGIAQFFQGLKDSIADLTAPNGQQLSAKEREGFLTAVAQMAQMVDKELLSADEDDSTSFNPRHSEYTELVLGLLVRSYADQITATNRTALSSMGIGGLLDDIPTSLMTALQKQGLKLARS